MLICRGNKCKYTLKPTAISRHLRDKHNTLIKLQKQVDEYVKEFLFVYNYATV
jgi:Orsellinic acid/F9775 biosynthesis cluster protein D